MEILSKEDSPTVKWIWMLIQKQQPVISAGIRRGGVSRFEVQFIATFEPPQLESGPQKGRRSKRDWGVRTRNTATALTDHRPSISNIFIRFMAGSSVWEHACWPRRRSAFWTAFPQHRMAERSPFKLANRPRRPVPRLPSCRTESRLFAYNLLWKSLQSFSAVNNWAVWSGHGTKGCSDQSEARGPRKPEQHEQRKLALQLHVSRPSSLPPQLSLALRAAPPPLPPRSTRRLSLQSEVRPAVASRGVGGGARK